MRLRLTGQFGLADRAGAYGWSIGKARSTAATMRRTSGTSPRASAKMSHRSKSDSREHQTGGERRPEGRGTRQDAPPLALAPRNSDPRLAGRRDRRNLLLVVDQRYRIDGRRLHRRPRGADRPARLRLRDRARGHGQPVREARATCCLRSTRATSSRPGIRRKRICASVRGQLDAARYAIRGRTEELPRPASAGAGATRERAGQFVQGADRLSTPAHPLAGGDHAAGDRCLDRRLAAGASAGRASRGASAAGDTRAAEYRPGRGAGRAVGRAC